MVCTQPSPCCSFSHQDSHSPTKSYHQHPWTIQGFPKPAGAATLLYFPTSLRSLLSSTLILRKIHTSRNSPSCFNVVDLLVYKLRVPNQQTCHKDHVSLFWKGTNLLAPPKTILSCPKWNAANQFQFPKPELDGVIVVIPQSENKIIWSFQSKAWYDNLIFLAEWWYVFFSGAQTQTGEIPKNATKLQKYQPGIWVL